MESTPVDMRHSIPDWGAGCMCAIGSLFPHPVAKLKLCFGLYIGVRSRSRSQDTYLVYRSSVWDLCSGYMLASGSKHPPRLPLSYNVDCSGSPSTATCCFGHDLHLRQRVVSVMTFQHCALGGRGPLSARQLSKRSDPQFRRRGGGSQILH